jgi:hypothetical protein
MGQLLNNPDVITILTAHLYVHVVTRVLARRYASRLDVPRRATMRAGHR